MRLSLVRYFFGMLGGAFFGLIAGGFFWYLSVQIIGVMAIFIMMFAKVNFHPNAIQLYQNGCLTIGAFLGLIIGVIVTFKEGAKKPAP